ncbi:TetR/AcrR family transcriptional regulator [Mycobacterium sp. 236(2023)]|uniref:TetR/AcrR family transcriptional regulator n=1 Tax=Mycobacterium sp. 236(2023) TaxID=3038163 RepID=UPI0024154916|nr:TetR/AcrR family transcriptional regulator [Mycobacterium sp. 236(2023)]MDG4664677.1 TetR/AcrR family transcriptional regulator [Mycobacterium sp. 236(2023)]
MSEQSRRQVPASVATKLYAASDVIAAKGLENTKIEDIAKASGVPKATLYYHFAGKDEILAFLLKDSLAVMAAEVADAADSAGSGRDRLAAVIRVHVQHTMRRPGSSRALVGDLGRAIRLPELATAVQEVFYDPITRVLRAGAEDGSLRAVRDPGSDAVSIFGAVILTAMLHNVIDSETSEKTVADGVVELLMNGLAPSG